MTTKASPLRHWAILTAMLYGLTLSALALPLLVSSFWGETASDHLTSVGWIVASIGNLAELYEFWQYWLAIGLLSLLQAGMLLFVPVDLRLKRRVPKRRWHLLAAVTSLMSGLLIAALVITVGEIVYQPHFIDADDRWKDTLWISLAVGIAGWICWGFIFWRFAGADDDQSTLRRYVKYLLRGSILELLVAVPCHVYVRCKDYCCAGYGTFIGIATGFGVMLFAFGPGVFFLFVDRARRLKRAQDEDVAGNEQYLGPVSSLDFHGRDTVIWILIAIVFLAGPALVALLVDLPDEARWISRIAFCSAGTAAAYHAVRSLLKKERLYGLPLFTSLLLGQAMLYLVCRWSIN